MVLKESRGQKCFLLYVMEVHVNIFIVRFMPSCVAHPVLCRCLGTFYVFRQRWFYLCPSSLIVIDSVVSDQVNTVVGGRGLPTTYRHSRLFIVKVVLLFKVHPKSHAQV